MPEITRYIRFRSAFTASTGRINPSAMMPAPNSQAQRLETSVYFIDGRTDEELWRLGDDTIGSLCPGRITLAASAVPVVGLVLDRDDDPPSHANIVGWPDTNWPETKEQCKALALKLVGVARLYVR